MLHVLVPCDDHICGSDLTTRLCQELLVRGVRVALLSLDRHSDFDFSNSDLDDGMMLYSIVTQYYSLPLASRARRRCC